MRIALFIICLALLFAGTATAGSVQLLSHQIECISANQDYATFQWHADIKNCAFCPKKAKLRIDLYDENGNVIGSVVKPVYLQGNKVKQISGNSVLQLDAGHFRDAQAKIMHVQPYGR